MLFYCFMPRFTLLLHWPLLPMSMRLRCSPLPGAQRARASTIHLSPASVAQRVTLSALRPQAPCPFVRYWRCISIVKYSLVLANCLLSGIQTLSAILKQFIYCVYGNSGRYIDCCPLCGRCPLLGGSVNRGSTVYKIVYTKHAQHSEWLFFF